MRTQINSMTAWLRANRADVPDSMIESVEFQAAAPKLTLCFPSEEGLASFGSRVLGNASVTKLEPRQMSSHYSVIYNAHVVWRKRVLNIFLVVRKAASVPADELFQRSTTER